MSTFQWCFFFCTVGQVNTRCKHVSRQHITCVVGTKLIMTTALIVRSNEKCCEFPLKCNILSSGYYIIYSIVYFYTFPNIVCLVLPFLKQQIQLSPLFFFSRSLSLSKVIYWWEAMIILFKARLPALALFIRIFSTPSSPFSLLILSVTDCAHKEPHHFSTIWVAMTETLPK